MILKIIADHGVHFRDGISGLAMWEEENFARYIGDAPFGSYRRILTDMEKRGNEELENAVEAYSHDTNNVIAWKWPETADEAANFERIRLRGLSYHNEKGAPGEQEELYVDARCSIYLMSDEGKTIERLV